MFNQLSFDILLTRMIVLVIAFTVHELAHALTADYFGDMTPRNQGRITLNPLKHLDPVGSLLLLVSGFGWARPVMVNPMVLAQAAPNAMMLVALAGPVSNLLLAVIGSIPFWFGLQVAAPTGDLLPSLAYMATEFVWINIILMFFNLIPLAPLDGEKVFSYFLPPAGQNFLARIRPYSGIILIVVVFAVPQVLAILVGIPSRTLFNLLIP